MQNWKTIDRKTILTHGSFLTVEEHTVALPDGRIISNWPWIITPDYINVVAVTDNGRFLFFRQVKYSIDGVSLAPVGGYLEPGEAPLAAAQRELLEETGYEAPTWTHLGSYPVDGNRGAGTAHFFLAENGRFVSNVAADDLEEQELLLLTRMEVEQALSSGEIKLLPWIAIVTLALRRLETD